MKNYSDVVTRAEEEPINLPLWLIVGGPGAIGLMVLGIWKLAELAVWWWV